MKNEYYVQCYIKKKIKNGCKIQTLWIPEQYAVIGKYIKLKGDDGWQVLKTFNKEEKKIVEANTRNYLKHRLATDI